VRQPFIDSCDRCGLVHRLLRKLLRRSRLQFEGFICAVWLSVVVGRLLGGLRPSHVTLRCCQVPAIQHACSHCIALISSRGKSRRVRDIARTLCPCKDKETALRAPEIHCAFMNIHHQAAPAERMRFRCSRPPDAAMALAAACSMAGVSCTPFVSCCSCCCCCGASPRDPLAPTRRQTQVITRLSIAPSPKYGDGCVLLSSTPWAAQSSRQLVNNGFRNLELWAGFHPKTGP